MKDIPVRHIEEPYFDKGFKIVKLDSDLSEKDMIQKLHRHNFYFALFLKKGSGEHTIDFISYPVADYTLFFMRPGQVHQLILKKGSQGYLLAFNRDFYLSKEDTANVILRKASRKNHYAFSPTAFQKLLPVLTSIHEEYTEKQDRYIHAVIAHLEILFIKIIRFSLPSKSISNKESQYRQERLEEFLELLQHNISSQRQVAEYANMMHLSTYQLNKIIKATIGKTCSTVINEYILLEAKRSLLGTSNQINQIAYHLGYEDTSYFIRFFKKHTGVSPQTYRNNYKQVL